MRVQAVSRGELNLYLPEATSAKYSLKARIAHDGSGFAFRSYRWIAKQHVRKIPAYV